MNKELTELLHECDTLKERLQQARPLPAEAMQKIADAMAIDYTYESNRIEGNTLTLQETSLVVNEGLTISGKSMREHLEAINHVEAIQYIKDIATSGEAISERTIKDIHGIILRGIDRANAGTYRQVPVMISGSRHTPPQPYLIAPQMEAFVADYKKLVADGAHPIIIAAFLHDTLVGIHPFIDGNGRTSRLVMNLALLQSGFPVVVLKGTAEAKLQYYTALETSHVDGNPLPFQHFVAKATKDALEQYVRILGV